MVSASTDTFLDEIEAIQVAVVAARCPFGVSVNTVKAKWVHEVVERGDAVNNGISLCGINLRRCITWMCLVGRNMGFWNAHNSPMNALNVIFEDRPREVNTHTPARARARASSKLINTINVYLNIRIFVVSAAPKAPPPSNNKCWRSPLGPQPPKDTHFLRKLHAMSVRCDVTHQKPVTNKYTKILRHFFVLSPFSGLADIGIPICAPEMTKDNKKEEKDSTRVAEEKMEAC